MEIKRKLAGREGMRFTEEKGVGVLTFPLLTASGCVRHLVSTRLGGVSEGCLGSFNLSFNRGDRRENVEENYRRLAAVLGCSPADFVCTDQTHTANVRLATQEDAGKGVVRPKDYAEVDALITDRPGLVLAAFYADCVPLLFVDPVHKAVGLAHSGWRGTAAGIGKRTLDAMGDAFGSRPEEILAAIGPSICGNCYEVGEEVAREFAVPWLPDAAFPPPVSERENGKYSLDLWNANARLLLEAGVRPEHLAVTDICTCCNPELLYSHRASGGRRGNFGAFLGILES